MINDERLIELVRENEILYNKTCPGYKLQGQKLAAWEAIARELGTTDQECSKRWTSLRERFSREQRAIDAPSGSAARSNTPWYLLQSMQFIKPYVTPRPTRCSNNILKGYSTSSTKDASQLWSPLSSSPILFPSTYTGEEQHQQEVQQQEAEQQHLLDDFVVASTPTSSKRKRNHDIVDDEFREVCQIFKDVQRERLSENRRLRSFTDMIFASLAEMTARKQTKAIKAITSVVMDLQLEPEE